MEIMQIKKDCKGNPLLVGSVVRDMKFTHLLAEVVSLDTETGDECVRLLYLDYPLDGCEDIPCNEVEVVEITKEIQEKLLKIALELV